MTDTGPNERHGSWTEPPCSCSTEFGGLTHTCDDPGCHVPGFVATLNRMADEQRTRDGGTSHD